MPSRSSDRTPRPTSPPAALAGEAASSSAFVVRAAPRAARPHVLLAEEDLITTNVIGHLLEHEGLAVTKAGDGPSALEALRGGGIGVALLGAVLAGVDGLEILRRIRTGEAGPTGIGVGILLWPGNDGLVGRAYGLGADDVIVRPLSLIDVSVSVHRLVHRRSR